MKLAPRDTWPEIRVVLLPLPWTWRKPRVYWDEPGGPLALSMAEFGPIWIEWGGQDGGWRHQFFEKDK
jgi:hypothetical protein